MHFTRLAILAIIGVAVAVPTPNGGGKKNDGDTTTTTCSNQQSTVCCDKSSKGCSVEDSCNNDQMQVCGNTVSLPRDVDSSLMRMLKRDGGRNNNDGGDTTTTTCSNQQSTMCCDESGKKCEISDSCSNNAVQMCGNILPSRSNLRLRSWGGDNNNDDGDTTTTTCTNSQSTMCCDESGKNCEVKDSCGNSAIQYCGNTISAPVTTYMKAKRDGGDGDQTTTTCSNSQSTMCCDKSGKNCEVKDSCSNDAVQICGNTVSVPVTVDAGDVTCMLYSSCPQ